jgi:hypothetical protein
MAATPRALPRDVVNQRDTTAEHVTGPRSMLATLMSSAKTSTKSTTLRLSDSNRRAAVKTRDPMIINPRTDHRSTSVPTMGAMKSPTMPAPVMLAMTSERLAPNSACTGTTSRPKA